MVTPAGLNQPVDDGSGNKIVKPSNNAVHGQYTFYIKASATNGGSNGYFGPYHLDVGCNARTATFTASALYADAPTLSSLSSIPKFVGDPIASAFTFPPPTSTVAYCVIVSNFLVNNDATGTTWSGSNQLNPTCAT